MAKLLEMNGGQAFDDFFPVSGKVEFHPPPIRRRRSPAQQSPADQPIHQSDCAMMANLQAFREFGDEHMVSPGKSLQHQQGLMLLHREPGLARGRLAEMQE